MKLLLLLLIGTSVWVYWNIYPIQKAIKKSKVFQDTAVAYEQHPESSTMKILVMGDSTAVGAGVQSSEFSIAGLVGKKYPDADITNISRFGMRLEELNQEIQKLPTTATYDLIVLQIGANDVTHFTSLSKIQTTLSSILNKAESKSPKIILLSSGNVGLSPVFKFPLSQILSKRTRDVREIYITEVTTRPSVSYIDLYKEREDDIFASDIDKYYANDYFHPSEDGYMVWYTEIEKKLP